MRRLNVFFLQSLIAVLGCLLLFAQCRTVQEDRVLPVPILTRGELNVDPVVQSTPENVALIVVDNPFHRLIDTDYPRTSRPKSDSRGYGQFRFTEFIKQDDLPKHIFQWTSTQRKNVMVAIFRNVVNVDSKANQITNKSDLVWMWTPPVGTLDPGRITYADGKAVLLDRNNQFTFSSPTNLNKDTYYVWCVLAWDDQGIRILSASRELPFRVS